MKSQFRALFAAVALAPAIACGHSEAHRTPIEGSPVVVRAILSHDELLPVRFRASGTVRGRNTTVLTSKTVGYVRAVRVRSGDHVSAGQLLVELEANDVRASVSRARAALAQSTETKTEAESAVVAARANAKIARTSRDRMVKLSEEGAIPPQQLDEAEARWRAAEAQEQMAEARVRALGSSVHEARAALGEASATLDYAAIAAPFSGRILERRVDPGALAAPGTPLLVVSDEGALRVEAAVEESHAEEVKLGGPVDVTLSVGGTPRTIAGTIGEIVPSVDVASRAFLVKVDLPPEAGALRPGTFARVGIRVGSRARLVVPTTAIASLGAIDRIFVIEGGHARVRMITRGDTEGVWTEVLSGLVKGELVVEAPPEGLRDGTPTEVRP